MHYKSRHFSSPTLAWLARAAASGTISRRTLARQLCEHENWRSTNGRLCIAQGCKALASLADRLNIRLPEAQPQPCRPPGQKGTVIATGYEDVTVRCGLDELDGVWLEPVAGGDGGPGVR